MAHGVYNDLFLQARVIIK